MNFPKLSRFSLPAQFGIFLACLLPLLWSLIFFNLDRLYTQTAHNNRVHISNLVRAFAEEVNSSVNSIDFALIDLREEWISNQEIFASTVKRRQSYLEENVGFQVGIINASGMLEFSSADPEAKPIDLSDREHFKVHRERAIDQLFISKPIFGRVSKRWSIQFTRPLRDKMGNFAGVIVLSVAPDYFSRFYKTIDLGNDSTITLLRRSGEILARSPDPEKGLGKVLTDVPYLQKIASESGFYEKRSEIDGVKRLYGWRILPKGEVSVAIGTSFENIFETYEQQRKAHITVGLILSVLLGIIGYFLLSGLQKLQAEQKRMRIILENSHDAFVAIDSRGQITDWNNKAEITFGWKAMEVIGKELGTVLLPEEKRSPGKAGFEHFVRVGGNKITDAVIELEALHRSGQHIPVEFAIAEIHHNRDYAATAFIRDISERKQAEQINIKKTRELEETQKVLQHAQKMEALGRLTGGIAHDFNNVLQTLSTGIQLALFSVKERTVVSALEACQRAIERGVELARQLSVFGRVQEVNLKTIDLVSQINGMTQLFRSALPSNIDVDIKFDEALWPVKVDALQLELALLNLAMNARDAMPSGGQFIISAKNEKLTDPPVELAPGDYVHLVISDTGEGMSTDVLAKALDPFYTTKPVGKGSGMGLPQVYGFAKQMGGTLVLESEVGKGVKASMYLPKTESEVMLDTYEPLQLKQMDKKEQTILFVEDDALVRQTVAPTLELAGFKVIMANTGEEALELLDQGEKFDLIFSDIVMPGQISGIDLAEIVHSRFPNMHIVLATGYSEQRVLTPHVRTLPKPYKVDMLVDAICEELAAA